MAFLGGIFGGNTTGADTAAQQQKTLSQFTGYANNELTNSEIEAGKKFFPNYFTPFSNMENKASPMYASALGLNGAGGTAEANAAYRGSPGYQGAFQEGPGYQFALGQGMQALDRSAAGSGTFGSGGAAMALNRYGQGIANQEYGNWQNRSNTAYNNWLAAIGQGGQQGLTAAAGQLQRQSGQANVNLAGGLGRAANYQQTGKNASDAYGQGAYADAQANAQGGSNLFSTLLGGLNLAGKFF